MTLKFIFIVVLLQVFSSQTDAFSFGGKANFASGSTATSHVIVHGFLDGLFGGGGDASNQQGNDAILASYDVRTFDANNEAVAVGYDSLSDYITEKWMDLFESKSISLTTPVKVYKRSDGNQDTSDNETETITESANCRLVFQKVDTGYKDDETDEDQDDKTEQEKQVKQGGVEIVVQQVTSVDTAKQTLRVIARRCEVDDDTMIKEMSEEIILKELQKAIGVWKKEAA